MALECRYAGDEDWPADDGIVASTPPELERGAWRGASSLTNPRFEPSSYGRPSNQEPRASSLTNPRFELQRAFAY